MAQDERDWVARLRLKYGSELRRFLQRKVRERTVAEDLEQDTYVKLQALREGDARNPRALLFTTASNLAITYLVRARDEDSIIERSSAEEVADRALTPSRAAELEEALHEIGRVLEGMPRKLREVWVMRVVEDLSHKEIARALNITVDAVDQRLVRAMILLRQKLSLIGIDDVVRS